MNEFPKWSSHLVVLECFLRLKTIFCADSTIQRGTERRTDDESFIEMRGRNEKVNHGIKVPKKAVVDYAANLLNYRSFANVRS